MVEEFLCQPLDSFDGNLLEIITPKLDEFISPELIDPKDLASINFQPSQLGSLISADATNKFADCPKLVVINELPGDAASASGVYKL